MKAAPGPRIRTLAPEDAGAARDVIDAAFGAANAHARTQGLRDDGLMLFELIASEDGEIVGHIAFSALELDNLDHKPPLRAAALSSLAVAPTHQGHGIGSALVRQGLEKCHEFDVEAVIVKGDAKFFARFGFSADPRDFQKIIDLGQNLMVLPLKNGIF